MISKAGLSRVLAGALAAAGALGVAGASAIAQDRPPPPPPPFQGTELGEGPWNLATEHGPIKVEVMARLERPWGLAFLPQGGMLVTERPGRLRYVRADGTLAAEPISGLPAMYTLGIAGLMDIALHPDFAKNRLVYMSYSKIDPDNPMNATLAVMRGRWDGGGALADVEDIFVAQAWYGAQPMPGKCCGQGPPFGSFGGRIVFDAHGHLFVASGDRNFGEMVANPANHFGKILRLTDEGRPAEGNPWLRHLGHAPETWSTGHRNPLGLTIDPANGTIWSSEFGPRGGDEVNRIERGGDYGWMRVTQGHHYDGTPAEGIRDVPGVIDPVLAFGPPSFNPGNLAIYRGSLFGGWDGNLLLASFSAGLHRYRLDENQRPAGEPEILLRELGQRWRDVRVGPDGALYMLSDQTNGALLRVTPAG